MKPITLPVSLLLLALLGAGCRHKPVYPDVGSVYITSDPPNAEVLLDGSITSMRTPVMINGIPTGEHNIGLRSYGRKRWSQTVRIEPGITKRLATTLHWIQPHLVSRTPVQYNNRCMAYLPEAGRIYVGSRNGPLMAYQVADSLISGPVASAPVSVGQLLVAASPRLDRIYAYTTYYKQIAILDAATLGIVRTLTLPGIQEMGQLLFSPTGGHAAGIDSAARRLWVFDADRDTIEREIGLAGCPMSAAFSRDGGSLYLCTVGPALLEKIDIESGSTLTSIALPGPSAGLFLDTQERRLGFCRYPQLQVGMVDLGSWQTLNGPTGNTGDRYRNGCFSGDGAYIWVLAPKLPYGIEPTRCDSGYVSLIYLPTWQYVSHLRTGQQPWEMAQSPDGRFLYVLDRFSADLLVFRTDTD